MSNTLLPSIVLNPLRAVAPVSGAIEVLIRVQAPDRPPTAAAEARRPMRLALVIDRSGSMSGEPLDEALRCAEYISAGLQPHDQVGVVLYDNSVSVALPLSPGGSPGAVRAALASVESGGTTALHDGWLAGARLLEQGSAETLSRVLLLSDGQANEGLCDPDEIQKHCADWAARGVSTTTVGLGRAFNEELMIGMARAGGGQQYYGQTAADLHDSFDEELSLLKALYLRGLRCKLVPGQRVIAEPLGLVHKLDGGRIGLSDLAWGAEAWLVVRLHISRNVAPHPGVPEALLAVTLEGEIQDGASWTGSAVLSLPLVSASDYQGASVDDLVRRRVKEVGFAEALGRVSALAAAGDRAGARQLLQSFEAQLEDTPWLADKARNMQALLERDLAVASKEMMYSSQRSSRRLARKIEPAYMASETGREDIPAYLRRKGSEGQGRRRPGP